MRVVGRVAQCGVQFVEFGIREAMLKAVGFGDRTVLVMVLAESLIIAAVGGALGLGLAVLAGVTPLARITAKDET